MDASRAGAAKVALVLSDDELLTLRHCVVEALEALGEDEFRIRTGSSKHEAEAVLSDLKDAGRLFREDG